MTPQDFINDLNRVREFKDNRVLIWYCNLHIEHFVKLIYKKYKANISFGNCSTCQKSLEPGFLSKVDELLRADLIDGVNEHEKLIKLVYQSRNTAGHELNFDEIKIGGKIIKALSVAKMEDPHGLISKVLKNVSHWKQFEISTMAVVTALYQKHEEMEGRALSSKLVFLINPEKNLIYPEMVSREYQGPE